MGVKYIRNTTTLKVKAKGYLIDAPDGYELINGEPPADADWELDQIATGMGILTHIEGTLNQPSLSMLDRVNLRQALTGFQDELRSSIHNPLTQANYTALMDIFASYALSQGVAQSIVDIIIASIEAYVADCRFVS